MEQKEPSMEEILSSIRRILSHEEETGTVPVAEQPASQNQSTSQNKELAVEADVMELTPQMAVAGMPEVQSDTFIPEDMVLLSEAAVQASTDHLSGLLQRAEAPVRAPVDAHPTMSSNANLEEIVMTLLRPYLKEWLDKNLPGMVERIVQREVSRLVDKVQLP